MEIIQEETKLAFYLGQEDSCRHLRGLEEKGKTWLWQGRARRQWRLAGITHFAFASKTQSRMLLGKIKGSKQLRFH